jgi:ankyrin repeat protein
MNIFKACDHGDWETVMDMVMKDSSLVNARDRSRWTPLHVACIYGHLAMVKFLVSNGAYVNANEEYWRTPVLFAYNQGHLNIVHYLKKQPLRVALIFLCHSRVFSHDLVRSLFTYFV